MPSADNPKEYTFRDDSRFMPNATGYFKDTTRVMPTADEEDEDPFSEAEYAAADAAEAEIVARRNLRRDDSEKLKALVKKKATPDMGYERLSIDDEYSEPLVERQTNREPINYEDAVDQRLEELTVNDSPYPNMDQARSFGAIQSAKKLRAEDEYKAAEARRQMEVEEGNEEAPSYNPDELTGDFRKIMGSSFDPKSSVDAQKMDVLLQFKQQYPELSTNALALKIYRSGAL